MRGRWVRLSVIPVHFNSGWVIAMLLLLLLHYRASMEAPGIMLLLAWRWQACGCEQLVMGET